MMSHDNGKAPPFLLLVDDDEVFRRATSEILRDEGYRVEAVPGAAEGSRQSISKVRYALLSPTKLWT